MSKTDERSSSTLHTIDKWAHAQYQQDAAQLRTDLQSVIVDCQKMIDNIPSQPTSSVQVDRLQASHLVQAANDVACFATRFSLYAGLFNTLSSEGAASSYNQTS